jgi:outer membrane protein
MMKKTNKLNSLLIVCVLAITSVSAQQKMWTLQEAVDYALENNLQIQQTKLDYETAEQNVVTAKGNFLPDLNASASQLYNFGSFIGQDGNRIARDSRGNNFSLNTGVTLFNGFRNTATYKQAQLGLETSQLQLEILNNDVSLNVVNAYLNILFNKESLSLANEQIGFTQSQFNQVKELVDAGVRARIDLLDSESQLASDQERLVNAENSVELSLLSLSQLLQLPKENFDIETLEIDLDNAVLLYKDTGEILSYALTNRPEIKNAELNIENADLNIKIAKSAYFPTVNFGAGASTSYQHLQGQDDVIPTFNDFGLFAGFQENGFTQQVENNLGYNLGLSVNIPIFNGFQTKANVTRSEIDKKRLELALEQQKQTLSVNIEQAFTDAKAALKQYEASEKSVELQELAFENAQTSYNLGASNVFELEQVKNRLLNAQSSYLNAKYNFVFKTKVLDFYLGKSITN